MSREPDAPTRSSDAESQLRDVEREIVLLEDQRADVLVTGPDGSASRTTSSPATTRRYVGLLETQAALLQRIDID